MRLDFRHLQAVEEDHVGIDSVAAHLLDNANLDLRAVEVGVEEAEALGLARHLLQGRGPRQDQGLIGDLGGRDPDLLPGDDVVLAALVGAQLDLRGVEAGVGLGHRKAGLVLAADQRRQHAVLLLLRAEDDDRLQPEDVDVDGRRAGHGRPALCDGAHHDRGLEDAEPGPALRLRHGDPQPAAICNRSIEILRKGGLSVPRQPVVFVEEAAELQDFVADLLLIRGELELHGGLR